MCGIIGLWNFDQAPVDRGLLQQMNSVLSHRGPDDQGIYLNTPVGLGNSRLSIIDLTGGHQPMFNDDGTVVIAYNGEIYNYRVLKSKLEKLGHRFRTNSDTETIIHLYEEYGKQCLEHLRGMFAFAIHDIKRNELFIVRDRLGIKPLYYYHDSHILAFASEVKALLQHPLIDAHLNLGAVREYFDTRYVVAPHTLFDGILKLEPGHFMVVNKQGLQRTRYWNIRFALNHKRSSRESASQLLDLLSESVRLRMVSDVPIGVFLSGGLDSSTVVALMSRYSDRPVKTFTAIFGEGEPVDETEYARIVSRHCGTEHHELLVKPTDCSVLEEIIWHLEEPIGDAAILPTYLLAQLTRQHVKVVLTGEGSDETNAGYAKYLTGYRTHQYERIPVPLRKISLRLANRFWYVPGLQEAQRYEDLGSLERARHMSYYNPIGLKILNSAIFSSDKEYSIGNCYLPEGDTIPSNPLNAFFYYDFKTWLPNDLLLKIDKMTMAHSLEARVPFLDHRVIEFNATVPPELKLGWTTTKRILRKTVETMLPREILERKQHGFNVPLDLWLESGYSNYLLSLIRGNRNITNYYFDEEELNTLIESRNSNDTVVWMVALFILFHRKFIS